MKHVKGKIQVEKHSKELGLENGEEAISVLSETCPAVGASQCCSVFSSQGFHYHCPKLSKVQIANGVSSPVIIICKG